VLLIRKPQREKRTPHDRHIEGHYQYPRYMQDLTVPIYRCAIARRGRAEPCHAYYHYTEIGVRSLDIPAFRPLKLAKLPGRNPYKPL